MGGGPQLDTFEFDGKLVLIGGGEFSHGHTEEIDRYLVAELGSPRVVAFLPTASGSSEYANQFGAYLKGLDQSIEVINVPVYRGRDVRRRRSLETIAGAGMVYLGGGVVNHVTDTIAGTPVEDAMRVMIAEGGVIAAIGGAAAAFGSRASSMLTHGAPITGFGWLRDTMIEPAFDGEPSRTLRETVLKRKVSVGIGIPSGTALAVGSGGETSVVGSGEIAVLRAPRA